MLRGEVIKATNDSIVPISLTRDEVLESRIKQFEKKDLELVMAKDNIEKSAERLVPIFKAEIVVREMKLNKKMPLWTNQEVAEFEYYFANKYII